jgi:zinc protease
MTARFSQAQHAEAQAAHPLRLLAALALLIALAALPRFAAAEVKVEEVTSPGGLTAWLVRDETVPVTAIEFTFEGGGAGHDPDGRTGTANLTAALLTEGAGDLDSSAFQRRLEDQSIRLSFDAGRDSFSGTLYTLNRYREDAVALTRLALSEPRFDEQALSRVRDRIMVGLRQEQTDPGSVASKTLRQLIFGSHPYAEPVSGTLDSVPAITPEDMRAFMAGALTRDRLKIGVVGDITPEELGPILDDLFSALPAEGRPDPTPEFEGAPPAGTAVVEMDVPQSTVFFAQPGLKIEDERYYAGMVLNYVLGGGSFSSMLTQEIRVERGLAYSVYSFLQPMDQAALLRGGAATENARVGETVDLIRQVIADIKENGLPPDRIADAKTYLTGSFPLRFTSASRIAAQLSSMQVHGFPIDYLDTRNDRVEAVTDAEVNALAANLLAPDALTIVVVGKPEGVEATLPAPGG